MPETPDQQDIDKALKSSDPPSMDELRTSVNIPANINHLFDLTGRVALVSGAASGLGCAIALGLASFGADVAVTDMNGEGLRATAEAITRMGRRAYVVVADVTDWGDVTRMVQEVLDFAHKIDICFNIPGINNRKPVLSLTPEEYDHVLNVNIHGLFRCAKAVGEVMVRQRRGSMINMSSIFGHVVMDRQAAYASSKGAIIQLTKVLAVEWAPFQVRVNAIAPAHHKTPLVQQMVSDASWYEDLIRRIPMSRFGEVWEIIGPAVFLASDASSFVTGISLICDGGWTAL